MSSCLKTLLVSTAAANCWRALAAPVPAATCSKTLLVSTATVNPLEGVGGARAGGDLLEHLSDLRIAKRHLEPFFRAVGRSGS
jgi:hypothetical protein